MIAHAASMIAHARLDPGETNPTKLWLKLTKMANYL